ncbi:hypothetical protein OnM2_010025, partial [Erysiphe neolycopersici]
MSGDFERIRLWIGRTNPSWITTLEAIFMVLESKSALYSPVTAFTRLSPLPNETMTELAWRIRATNYEIPAEDQERRFCKATLIEHIKDFLPQIWSLMRVESSNANSSEIVEMLVARTEEYMKYNSSASPQLPNISQPHFNMTISDPRTDTQ